MPTDNSVAISLAKESFPQFLAQREEALIADAWIRGDNAKPSRPLQPSREYTELEERSYTPWLGLVVTAVAQALYVEGHRPKKGREDSKVWKKLWQPNGMDARQIPIHRAAIGHGESYAKLIRGRNMLTQEETVAIRGSSMLRMACFWQDAALDEYPMWAFEADQEIVNGNQGWRVWITDENTTHEMVTSDPRGEKDFTYIEPVRHDTGVPPVVRFSNNPDLDGNSASDIVPFIPLASRIDQDTFDRLIVQRFGAWKVRYIAGMAKPGTEEQARLQALALRVEDLLVSTDSQTKFGTLDETPLDGFIKSRDADIRDLAAVTQTPPHHLLGMSPNVSADALAETQSGLMRKVDERKHLFGESWERVLRLGAHMSGMEKEASDFESQMLWKDTESRSLAQSADALGKLAQMLGVPYELLWERIPGWTTKDTEDAKEILQSQRAEAMLMQELGLGANDATAAQGGNPDNTPPSTEPNPAAA